MELESQTLDARKEELIKIKEELKRAKEKATQSWLDSRPLIDELEKLKSDLANYEAKNVKSETLIFELEFELKAIESSIKSKKEGESKAARATEELTRALEQLREETETAKRHSDEVRQKRSRLKQGLRVKRQKLNVTQLMLVAAKREIEAYNDATNEAIKYSSLSEITESVKLSHEEYEASKKRANDENALADSRILVAMEEKAEAEKNRDLAMAKWNELKKKRVMKMKRGQMREENNRVVVEEGELGHGNKLELVEIVDENPKVIKVDDQPNKKENYHYLGPEQMRRTRPKKNLKNKKKKKMSFFMQMRQCFGINIIKRLFG